MEGAKGQKRSISFGKYIKSSPRVWAAQLLWVLVTAIVVLSLLYLRLAGNKQMFYDQASHAYNAVYEKIKINETVLEGFASMLRLAGDSPTIRQYTAEMRLAYPHIYSVGFQQYVPAQKRDMFEQSQRDKGYVEFEIKDFSYEDSREFHDVVDVTSYYPTLFGESFNPDAQMVLGLDQFAVPFLKEALLRSIHTGRAIATQPFTLAEGGRGYVLYKSLEAIPDFDPESDLDVESNTVSILIKTDDLLRFASEDMPHATAKLSYRDTGGDVITESIESVRQQEYAIAFGKLIFQRQLDEFGQPFQLILEADSGLSSWDIALAVALFCLSGCISWFYFQNTYRSYLSNMDREQALRDLADERKGLEQRVAERTEALNQKTDEIRQLASKLVNLQEDDYRYIARELHDEFGQLITAIGINTKLVSNRIAGDSDADKLSSETQTLVDQLHTSMHSLIGRLRPEALDTFGLKVSIEHCIDLFKLDQSGVECELVLDASIDQLPDNYAITIYRAIQELVNNAIRHGKPKKIVVNVRLIEGQLVIAVDDDGCGMDTNSQAKGYGLSGLNERLSALKGEMTIVSSPASGCRVEITLPLAVNFRESVLSE